MSDSREPREVKTPLRCQECNTPFFGKMMVNVDVTQAMKTMLANRCPSCGSDKLFMGLGLSLSEDRERRNQDSNSIQERIEDWKENGETGLSSEAVLQFMTSHIEPAAYPHDYDDLRRLILLLDRFPEWKDRMHQLSAYRGWGEIARRWNEIETAVFAADPEARNPKGAKSVLETVFRND